MDRRARSDSSTGGPPREALAGRFHVQEVRSDGDRILYFGEPLVPQNALVEQLWPAFREAGYEVHFTTADRVDVDPEPDPGTGVGSTDPAVGPDPGATNGGEPPDERWMEWATPTASRTKYVLVAEPVSIGVDKIPWTNVVLLAATVLSTLYAGSLWYHIDVTANPADVLRAWPFTLAIMGVLGVHELGHYVMSRYHGVNASLPYFIPVPTLIGTMGAVIKMKGRMPDRKALFDIGVAGPLAGLVATVVVTAIGLTLNPIPVPEAVQNSSQAVEIHLGFPPLMYLIALAVDQPLAYGKGLAINPVVIGGWVGMFVTFLNLLPVGQLDGGHILRAMAGEHQQRIAALVPAVLFGLAGYLYFLADTAGNAVFIWVFWGLFASLFAFVGPATPVRDETLKTKRMLVGVATFVFGVLCFTPVPIAIAG
jgi:membrane-associated protease RseP (regulator of RpoE activity)